MTYTPTTEQHLRSWLDSAVAAHKAGCLDQALSAYQQILSAAPEHVPALNLAGTALLQLGRPQEGLHYLERAADRSRNDPNLLGNLAQAYLALERYAQAAKTFRTASRLAPEAVQFQVGTAAALALQGKLEEAERLLRRLSTRFPRAALVWLNLGNVLRDTRRFESAIEAYERALELEPAMVDARNGIGSVLHSLLRFGEAEQAYRACIEDAPDNLVPRYNLVSLEIDMGRFAEAEALSREIVARAPAAPEALRFLGTSLALQGRLIEALDCYACAVTIAPDDAPSARIYGVTLMETGRAAEGLRWLSRAAALEPESLALKRMTAGALLAHGHLHDAWAAYADRPDAAHLRERYRAMNPLQPLPHALAGLHVCVLGEQGLGDQLFFLRYVPLLAARGARVSHRAGAKLRSLLERGPSLDTVLPEEKPPPAADAYVLAGDLPRLLYELPSSPLHGAEGRVAACANLREFRRSIAVFWPQPAATLRIAPDPHRLAQVRDQLAAAGPAPYIGVTWRGGTAPERQSTQWVLHKSIDLPALATALEGLPGTVVALQREPAPREIETLAAALKRPVHDLSALNDDLEGMFALLALVDEYVGVSNTNMHLRAAAGRSARVLVPVPAEWRWMQSGLSPWFPGFAIYRQSLAGDWSGALGALRRDLDMNYGSGSRSNTPDRDDRAPATHPD